MPEAASLDRVRTASVDAFEFRPAAAADIPAMVRMYHDFFDESDLAKRGLAYDPSRMWAYLFRGISTGDMPFILAITRQAGELVGGISYTLHQGYTEQPFADLGLFYVKPKWRGSPVARVLMTLCLEIAKADGAVMFNAGISSGIDPASLVNLLHKMGFEDTNSVLLVRRL